MTALILLGGGGHCGSVIDSIRAEGRYRIAGIVDVADKVGAVINGVPIVGTDEHLREQLQAGVAHAFITIGSTGDVTLRQRLDHLARQLGFVFPSIIDPSAIVSPTARIAGGVFVGKGAVVNVNAEIGEHSIVNSGAIIEHDCRIGAFCHIAPGAVLSGGVIVGKHTHIGTNATVIQGVEIGTDVLIGAGSVVVRDVGDGVVAYGNPCRVERSGHEQ